MSSRRMNRFIFIVAGCCSVLTGCMKWDYDLGREIAVRPEVGHGLFITNEGNFQYGNATLSFYDTQTRKIDNEVFFRANDQKLGDVAQSMTMYGGLGWIVVNNSHVIFAIDPVTFKEVGRITNLTSPRYIHFLSDEKAYVTQIWDTETDKVVDELVVGIQPTSLVMDKYDKMWTITDGGYEGSPYGHEAPSLYRIDAATFRIEKQFKFKFGDWPSEVQLNGGRDTLYFINNDIWRMPVVADHVPVRPFLKYKQTKFYGLSIDPNTSEVYVADAIDYQQKGIVYRYSPEGELLDEFRVGIIPGAFCWY